MRAQWRELAWRVLGLKEGTVKSQGLCSAGKNLLELGSLSQALAPVPALFLGGFWARVS